MRPIEPEFRAAQRARITFDREVVSDVGWVRLDGPWVHFRRDDDLQWASYPAHVVRLVKWAAVSE